MKVALRKFPLYRERVNNGVIYVHCAAAFFIQSVLNLIPLPITLPFSNTKITTTSFQGE